MSQGVTRGDITVTATGDGGILLTIADGESQVQIECQSRQPKNRSLRSRPRWSRRMLGRECYRGNRRCVKTHRDTAIKKSPARHTGPRQRSC